MILYSVVILICMALIALFNIIFIDFLGNISIGGIILYVTLLTISVIIIDLILAGIFCQLFPKKYYNPFKKRFNIFKWEKRFYETIGIKKWKDKIPDLGKLDGFAKRNAGNLNDNKNIMNFMEKTCSGEITHMWSIPFGFLIILLVPINLGLSICLPIAIVNAVLNYLPFVTQRYNRRKLLVAYERNKRKEQLIKEKVN